MEEIKRSLVLTSDDIKKKISRISFEIWENNYDESEIILAGIFENGFNFAHRLEQSLKRISSLNILLSNIRFDKHKPAASKILFSIDPSIVNNKVIIVCDDVANTGKTLLYAMKPFLDYAPKKIQVAVLVDRRHKTYPVSADYVGLSVSTSLQEHITVEMGSNIKEAVYLS